MQFGLDKVRPTDEIGDMAIALMRNVTNADELSMLAAELATNFCVEDYHFCPEPAWVKPLRDLREYQQTDEYQSLSAKDKRHRKRLIYNRDEVQKHIKERAAVRNKNIFNAQYLEELLELWMYFDDKDRFRKVWEIYNSYPNTLLDGRGDVAWRKRLNWGKQVSPQLKDKAREVFGGEVVSET